MPNRLAAASSLYLRQHADDPVDWWPWSADALALARQTRRPILLSVGYAACHWCHAMARESFADALTAGLINRHYVPIKVDRDLRPDIDRTYQLAHQALQHRPGGWPLTAFLDPDDLLPFFIGTYFPAHRSYGLPGFREVLEGLSRWFAERPEERAEQARTLRRLLREHGLQSPERGTLNDAPLRLAAERWQAAADREHGGSRGAPKFPRCSELEFALRCEDPALIEHARLTLYAMAAGGLQDQVGGGFFRYCVDAAWALPHFEKMLQDNAQLLPLYAARAAAGDREARRAATGIATWLNEEMPLGAGGYAAALDADSAGREGGVYLWQQDGFDAAVPEPERGWLRRHLGLDRPASVGDRDWHLRLAVPLAELAAAEGVDVEILRQRRTALLRRLKLFRARRAAPLRDEACLAFSNGLLLSGLARAAAYLDREDWAEQAVRLAGDLQRLLWRDGRLYSAAGEAPAAFLDDHAALLCGLLDLLECRFQCDWLDWAEQLAECLLLHFEDAERGGFWFSAHDAEALPRRDKPFLDESAPAGNALAAQGLLRLGTLTAEPRYLEAAERCLRAAWPLLREQPQGAAAMLSVLREWLRPRPLLVARLGDVHEHERWNEVLQAAQAAGLRLLRVPAADGLLPEALEDKRWLRGGRVYWCEGTRCLPRFDSPVALRSRLDSLG
jgi:uncharacterized protein YyaL (SSP411 family)